MILDLKINTLSIKKHKSIALLLFSALISLPFLVAYTSDAKKVVKDYKFYNLHAQGWKSKRINQFIGDINYTATEVPLQYYIKKNIGDIPQKIDSIYNANKRERIMEVEFQHAEQTDLLLEEYTHRTYEDAVKYMAFSIEKDFMVITSANDTIRCSGVQFERNFKVAPFKRALLYFNNITPDDNIQLLYRDQLFGNGLIKFNFNETPINL